jgi:hypothetical protein
LLLGWINVETNTNGTGLTWLRPTNKTGFFKAGFTNIIPAVEISTWTNPPISLTNLTNITLVISDSITNPTALFEAGVTISNKAYAVHQVSGAGKVTGSVNPKTGLLKVTFGGDTGKKTNAFGVFLQNTITSANTTTNATNTTIPIIGGGYSTNGEALQLQIGP